MHDFLDIAPKLQNYNCKRKDTDRLYSIGHQWPQPHDGWRRLETAGEEDGRPGQVVHTRGGSRRSSTKTPCCLGCGLGAGDNRSTLSPRARVDLQPGLTLLRQPCPCPLAWDRWQHLAAPGLPRRLHPTLVWLGVRRAGQCQHHGAPWARRGSGCQHPGWQGHDGHPTPGDAGPITQVVLSEGHLPTVGWMRP